MGKSKFFSPSELLITQSFTNLGSFWILSSAYALSNFRGALAEYVSTLDIQLDTRFECESQAAESKQEGVDKIWTEWDARYFDQSVVSGNISIQIVAPPPPPTSSTPPTHYLAPGALAPVLSDVDETNVTFPLIGAVQSGNLTRPHYRNEKPGRHMEDGKYDHAAKIWQRKIKLQQHRGVHLTKSKLTIQN